MKRLLRALFLMALGTVLAACGGVFLVVWMLPSTDAHVAEAFDGPYPIPEGSDGPLAGLVVYLSAGHGWLLHRVNHDGAPIAWGQQRSRRYGMVEDEWTADFVADYLAPAIEAQGGTVIALRERDRNRVAAISDDADPSSFAEEIAVGVSHEQAFDDHYLRLEPNGGAVWWLEVPHDGHWYLYSRWVDAPEHDPQAVYTVVVGDQVREVVVNQQTHGGHWWPLGDLCLFAGQRVEVHLRGSGGGQLSADAVRLGGGNYVFAPTFDYKVRDHAMFDVAMPHQIDHLGAPEDVATYACGTPVSDMRLRPHWASWASPQGEEAIYLSIHTNATARGRAQGLTVFAGIDRTPPTPAGPESVRLSKLLERGIYGRVSANDRGYKTRGVRLGNFSEISPVHNQLVSSLLEMGFHDDPTDAARLQTPQYREDAAAGIIDALVAFRNGETP